MGAKYRNKLLRCNEYSRPVASITCLLAALSYGIEVGSGLNVYDARGGARFLRFFVGIDFLCFYKRHRFGGLQVLDAYGVS